MSAELKSNTDHIFPLDSAVDETQKKSSKVLVRVEAS